VKAFVPRQSNHLLLIAIIGALRLINHQHPRAIVKVYPA
jgi:hypothetical protein